jgi:hypothetical protein
MSTIVNVVRVRNSYLFSNQSLDTLELETTTPMDQVCNQITSLDVDSEKRLLAIEKVISLYLSKYFSRNKLYYFLSLGSREKTSITRRRMDFVQSATRNVHRSKQSQGSTTYLQRIE